MNLSTSVKYTKRLYSINFKVQVYTYTFQNNTVEKVKKKTKQNLFFSIQGPALRRLTTCWKKVGLYLCWAPAHTLTQGQPAHTLPKATAHGDTPTPDAYQCHTGQAEGN